MNIKLNPVVEYQMMQQFFANGGNNDTMPEELLRTRRIWKRADELIRKNPHYDNEKIAMQLMADMPEYDMALSSAKRHVTNAKKYFDTVETETPATHRRILTGILYKQIKMLEEQQILQPSKAHQVSKVIESIGNRIAALNNLYEKEEKTDSEDNGGVFLVLSSNDIDFPDIPSISEKDLEKTIKKITEVVDISPLEVEILTNKDIKGNVL